MLGWIFEQEKTKLSNILNSRQILENFSYKLKKDLNSKNFFDNFYNNIDNINNMSDYDRKQYVKDCNEMKTMLLMLNQALKADNYISSKNSSEMIKSCNVFPDRTGREMIIQLSFLPLLRLFCELQNIEKIKQSREFFTNYNKTLIEDQNEKLFGKGNIFRKVDYDDDEEFIDYNIKLKYLEKLENESNLKKDNLEKSIKDLLEIYFSSNNKEETMVIMGSAYWDNDNKKSKERTEQFSVIFEKMFQSFEEETNKKISILTDVLTNKISNLIKDNKLVNVELSKDQSFSGNILITFENEINSEEIKQIQSIIICKSEMDLHKIKHKQNSNNIYEFSCYLDI